MKAKPMLILVGAVVGILLISGCITGAIVSPLIGREALLPAPGVHLAPQQITGEHAGEALHGGMQFVLTNTILSALITSVLLFVLFFFGARNVKLIPGRLQGLLELIVEGLLNFMEGVVGKARAKALFPIVGTIFIFVMFNAWIGLLPIYQSFGVTRWMDVSLTELNSAQVTTVRNQPVIEIEELEHILETKRVAELKHEGLDADTAEKEAHAEVHSSRVQITDDGALTKAFMVDGKQVKIEAQRFVGTAAEKIEAAGGEAHKKGAGLSATFVRPAGTDMNMPMALAIVAFFLIEVLGFRANGIGYLNKFFPVKRYLKLDIIAIFVGILEFLSEFIRIISFTFRLFGNMTAGEVLLLVSAFLASFVATVVFYGLELLVGLIQATIFAGLTLVFAAVATESHGEGEHGKEHVETAGHGTHGAEHH